LKTLTNPEIFSLSENDNGYTQFQLRISFQQFVLATTWRRGESSSTSQISKAVTWNGNMKSKKHIQSRSRALEDTNPEIFSLRQKDIGQSRKKQEWTEYTAKPTCKTRKGKNETKGFAQWN